MRTCLFPLHSVAFFTVLLRMRMNRRSFWWIDSFYFPFFFFFVFSVFSPFVSLLLGLFLVEKLQRICKLELRRKFFPSFFFFFSFHFKNVLTFSYIFRSELNQLGKIFFPAKHAYTRSLVLVAFQLFLVRQVGETSCWF